MIEDNRHNHDEPSCYQQPELQVVSIDMEERLLRCGKRGKKAWKSFGDSHHRPKAKPRKKLKGKGCSHGPGS